MVTMTTQGLNATESIQNHIRLQVMSDLSMCYNVIIRM